MRKSKRQRERKSGTSREVIAHKREVGRTMIRETRGQLLARYADIAFQPAPVLLGRWLTGQQVWDELSFAQRLTLVYHAMPPLSTDQFYAVQHKEG